jgi:hypothetical protein
MFTAVSIVRMYFSGKYFCGKLLKTSNEVSTLVPDKNRNEL